MKKYLLLIIALLFSDNSPGMFVSQPPFNEWQARIQQNPDLEKQIDQLLRNEVAKYHPGFTNWTWQGADNKARGQWSANLATRTISIPYPDLIFLSDYIMGKITKQAILSRLAILHHEITHIIKQHASIYHPSRIALANVLAYTENASEEHKQNLLQKAATEMQKTEWEADYGIPNIPNLMQTFSGVLRSRPSPHPSTPLSVTSHPHPLARASTADDRYAKLKVGQQINQGLTFAQDIKPKIEGTSPLKAAKVLGVEDPYYYPSLAQEDHPFEITLIGSNDIKTSLPYYVAMYANTLYNYMQDNPSKETEYPINIQDLMGQNIAFNQEDVNYSGASSRAFKLSSVA